MADHYRGLIKSLMKLGFLFKRQGERKHEIWRNRSTDQHVMFDRDEVARSRAAVAAVLKEASAPVEKPAARHTAGAKRPASGSRAAAKAARAPAKRRGKTAKASTRKRAARAKSSHGKSSAKTAKAKASKRK